MFATLFNVLTPVVLCVALGFGWGRSRVPYDSEFVTRLLTGIGAPCLIVSSIDESTLVLAEFINMAGLVVVMMVASALLAVTVFRLAGMDAIALTPSVTFPNTGNMGISLSLFAFGQAALPLAVIVFVTVSLVHFLSADLFLSRDAWSRRWVRALKQPLVYGALVALFLVATDSDLPPVLGQTVALLGDITIPMMLLTLGVSLSRLRAGDWGPGMAVAATRLLGGVAVGFAIVWWFDVEGLPAKVLILQSAMPAAVFNYLLALKYDRRPGVVAGGVVTSTFCSLLTLPFLLAFLLASD